MPFQSSAQRSYLYANHPKVAREFEKHTPKGKKLPKHKRSKRHDGERRKATVALTANRLAEARYVSGLRGVMRGVHKIYQDHLSRRQDAHTELSGDFDMLGVHVVSQIPAKVGPLFDRMANDVKKYQARGMAVVGIKPQDTRLGGALAAARDRNIKLVENAARDYASDVRDIFEDSANVGASWDELKQQLMERGSVSESRAELIARDQTLKVNGEVNQIRQTNAGVDRYIWSTSQDERVRDSHREKEGQVFDWSSPPPDTGHPGDDYQCRCIALPYLEPEEDL